VVHLLFVMAVGVVATYPEVPTWPLIAIVGSVALIVGIGGFPTSYTVWLAIDLRLRPLMKQKWPMRPNTPVRKRTPQTQAQ
jgi:hypothetical protein